MMSSAVTPNPADLMGSGNEQHVTEEERKWAVAKRYWYLITLIVPVLLIFSGVMAIETQSGQWLWLLVTVFFIVIPIVDFICGSDSFNPSEEEQAVLKDDRFYVKILYAATALQWAGLVSMTCVVTQGDFSWFNILGAILSVGAMHAVGLTMSHELGHKMNDKNQVLAAKICSACCGYAHFNIEHNKGHHKDVATPEDPASSRMGESLYQFALRELPGAARRGWNLEASRLNRQKRSVFSIHNELLQSLAVTVVAYGIMTFLFGWMALPFLLISAAYGWFQLTMANYIEHYGLLRQTLENGRFERCQPHHSWNNNFKASNLLTLHLQRHSDHHAHPTRPYQLLRDYQDAPELPHGYPGMMGMALIPPAWRMIMDHRVVEWAGGDMEKVNIDPAQREEIFSKFHNPKLATA
ncbi:alkane 1-monooxygenase [Alkalimarinus alittae]|uniref:Alkane 1-monooxygenase n=1 Tax=Alkalimarinus alittae TaxID=2961619 RepID=A0ABY6N2E3_9ALTE|nr:alkane 1-monooxygenase [Alkalimarinus alittae]UZE96205.1 alkane 1-monooxygenase [Alkalimarinus alittae]